MLMAKWSLSLFKFTHCVMFISIVGIVTYLFHQQKTVAVILKQYKGEGEGETVGGGDSGRGATYRQRNLLILDCLECN